MPQPAVNNPLCFGSPSLIEDGQAVNEYTINPILEQLIANDLHLDRVQRYFHMPSMLSICASVEVGALEGQPVYYNDNNNQYELSSYATEVIGGRTYLLPQAEVWGMIVEQITPSQARIAISGITPPIDLSAAIGVQSVTHRMYLSTQRGKLVKVPSDEVVPVYVATGASDGSVLVRPYSGDHGSLILQWKHHLETEAAGLFAVNGDQVMIASPDSNLSGWLPASDAVFEGNAPPGAVFGYNISQDEELSETWPPRYLNSVGAEFVRAGERDGAESITIGPDGLMIVDQFGIWWMSSCLTDAPFRTTGGTVGGSCPLPGKLRVTIYAARPMGIPLGDLSASGVSSLESNHPALSFTDRDSGRSAATGDLSLGFVLSRLFGTELGDNSHLAVKSAADGYLTRGPVVSRLKAGANVTLSPTHSSNGFDYGDVQIDITTGDIAEIQPIEVSLRRATLEEDVNVFGYGLPPGITSGITTKFHIPAAFPANFNAKLVLWVMADFSSGASAPAESLTVQRRLIVPPATVTDVSNLQAAAVSIGSVTPQHLKVVALESAAFTVTPGAVAYIDIDRAAVNAAYELQVVKQVLIPSPVVGA